MLNKCKASIIIIVIIIWKGIIIEKWNETGCGGQ